MRGPFWPPGARKTPRTMERLFDYFTNHPFLAGLAIVAVVAVLVFEWRQRAHGFAAISPGEAIRMMNQGALMIDVRSPDQYKEGHVEGARNVPGDQIVDGNKPLEKYAGKTLIMCCNSGATSAAAARTLMRQGVKGVLNLRGGIMAWRQDNFPVVRG